MKKILFLEDDPDQAESIEELLGRAFPNKEIVTCATESELLETIGIIAVGDLYFAVLDAMVPWCFPSEDMPIPPKDVQSEGIRYAGKRCLGQIRRKYGDDLPISIYSVLSTEGHGVAQQKNTFVLEKEPGHEGLIESIKTVISGDQNTP